MTEQQNHPTVSLQKYPAVLSPQRQQAIHDIAARLIHELTQAHVSAAEAERQAAQWKESRDKAIKAALVQVARAQAAEPVGRDTASTRGGGG
jgi:hypothetical protein